MSIVTNIRKSASYVFVLMALATLGSCDECKKDPESCIEEPVELITTVVVTLSPTSGGDNVVFRFEDKDGPNGGNPPTYTVGDLAANTDYNLSVAFLDESDDTMVEDVTEEIQDEAEEHQVFFINDLGINVSYSDSDANGNPVGLSCVASTGAATSGSFMVTLRHEPMKSEPGVSDGDIANAGGETDIEVSFTISVL